MASAAKVSSDALKFKDYSRHEDIDSYIASHVGEAWTEYRRKWKNAVGLKEYYDYPLYITVEQSFNCNYRCVMCYHNDLAQRALLSHGKRLSERQMRKIIDEAAGLGTPSICLNAGNEPLMDKDLYKHVAYARKKGILDVFITTNGSLLTEEAAGKLIDAGLTQIRVSIDAFTPETYRRIRTGGDFEKVKNNLLKLIELRGEKNSFFPIVRVSFVDMEINRHEFDDFKNYWKDIVDYVSVQRYTPVNQSEKMMALIPRNRERYEKTVCSMPFSMLYVRGNGDVYPCGRIEYGVCIGNIGRETIEEMWNNDKARGLRQTLKDTAYDKVPGCRACFASASLI